MDEEKKQQPEEVKIEDLAKEEQPAETGDVTGGGGVLQQTFNPAQMGSNLVKEEVQGLVWK